jgi:hypothetical protein
MYNLLQIIYLIAMIRTSKAEGSKREEMSQTGSISWIICWKTTLECRVEQAEA